MVAQGQPTWNSKPISGKPAGLGSFFFYLVTLYTHLPWCYVIQTLPFCTHTDPLGLSSPMASAVHHQGSIEGCHMFLSQELSDSLR